MRIVGPIKFLSPAAFVILDMQETLINIVIKVRVLAIHWFIPYGKYNKADVIYYISRM